MAHPHRRLSCHLHELIYASEDDPKTVDVTRIAHRKEVYKP
jgi:mRNA-degrading endonuclease RelE of RelBE toxin-antitoxin system